MTQTTRLLVPAAAVMAALLLDGCQASSSGEGIFPHPLRAGEIEHAVPFEGKDIVVMDSATRAIAP